MVMMVEAKEPGIDETVDTDTSNERDKQQIPGEKREKERVCIGAERASKQATLKGETNR